MSPEAIVDDRPDASPGRFGRWFGPLTGPRIAALLIAIGFLGGTVGWALAQGSDDPLSATDVGFMQDMGYHHAQAVEMSMILVGNPTVDDDLKHYGLEIILSQQADRGIFNATLDRFGHDSDPGDEVMGWMGPPLPLDSMEGLASDEEMADLKAATGDAAEALWIALMSDHHLGGLHMADYEARHGHDETTRNVARGMVKVQRGEVIDLERYRRRHDLPIPEGFTDPMKDQRLNPLSFSDAD